MTKEQWASIGYSRSELQDAHGYLDVTQSSVKQLGQLCSDGVYVGNSTESVLADPSRGTE